ncbi:MAG: Hpt domain-containing protein [Ferrimonas sp.]
MYDYLGEYSVTPNFEQLDTHTLDQYCALIGAAVFMKSVNLFEQMAPDYVQAVATGVTNQDRSQITAEAHKLKGAAGAVGLKRVQELAQLLQHDEAPQWHTDHPQWLALLQQHINADISALKAYLQAKS